MFSVLKIKTVTPFKEIINKTNNNRIKLTFKTHNASVFEQVILDAESDGARYVTQTHVTTVRPALVNASWTVVSVLTQLTVYAHRVVLKVVVNVPLDTFDYFRYTAIHQIHK